MGIIITKLIAIILLISISVSCSNESDTSGLVSGVLTSDDVNPETPTAAIVTLDSITVYSDKTSLLIGESAILYAFGRYSNGSLTNISNSVAWSSVDELKATVTGSLASATGAGSVDITATLDSISSALTLVPFSANVTSLELNYTSLVLPSAGSATIIVSALYDNGMSVDVSSLSTFVIDDISIASLTDSDVIAVANGTTNLTVSYGGIDKVLSISITTAIITSIQVTPIVASKAKDETQQFYATATLDDNSTLDISNSVTWSSSDSTVLEIGSTGIANLKTAGVVAVTATFGGTSNTVNFTVLDKSLSSLAVNLSASDIGVGVTANATVIATYSDSTTEDVTSSVNFSTSNSSVAIISNNTNSKGYITSFATGSADITATLNSVSNSATINITAASLVSIEVTTNNTLLAAGINTYFTAEGTYDDATEVDITNSVTWSVSNITYGSISNSPSNRGFFTNSFVLTTTETMITTANLDAITGSESVIMAPGKITSISINPSSATMNTSENLDFKAYANYSDGAAVEITNIVNWVSSDSAVVVASNSLVDAGRVSSLTEGSATMEALYNGMTSSSASIIVDNTQTPEATDDGDGLLAQYFNGNNFNTLAGTRIDSNINYNWDTGAAPLGVNYNFSVRWTGKIKGKFTGDCQISSRSDDGFRISIGGNSVLDIWVPHGPRWDHNYAVPFVEGEKQDIIVEFFENGGYAVSELYWQCPGDAGLVPIPKEYLYSN